jgi:hypothetical protein
MNKLSCIFIFIFKREEFTNAFDWLSTICNMPEMSDVEWSHFSEALRLAFALKVDTWNPSDEKQTSEA